MGRSVNVGTLRWFVPDSGSVVRCLAVAAVLSGIGSPARTESELFDSRGLPREREMMSELPFEHIDPLTGNLLLTFTDLVLPGNAGMDLKIQRTYNSKIFHQSEPDWVLREDSWAGLGWSLHMGRVIQSTSNSPTLEMPDGSQHRLYRHIGPAPSGCADCFVTQGHWVYDKSTRKLRLPDGVIYTFDRSVNLGDLLGWVSYATRIEDPFGNTIQIHYPASNQPYDMIERIVQDLGGGESREVKFTVDTSSRRALRTMSYKVGSSTRTWTFTHQDATGGTGLPYSVLKSVEPPVGPGWEFEYGQWNELSRLTTPHGGRIDYTYKKQGYWFADVYVVTRSVATRSISGRSIPAATWTYSYAQGPSMNQTVVAGPCRRIRTTFRGIGNDQRWVWESGLQEKREVAAAGDSGFSSPLEVESLTWRASDLISNVTVQRTPGCRFSDFA